MSTLDFYAGRQAANLANDRVIVDMERSVNDWVAYAKRLESDLALAQGTIAGLSAVNQALTTDLRAAAPESVLLHDNGPRRKIGIAAKTQYLNAQGYAYDPERKAIRKI